MLALHRPVFVAIVTLLSSCGVTYNSPKLVEDDTSYDVNIVEMTPGAVTRANASVYRPKTLPAAFSLTAGASISAKSELQKLHRPPALEHEAYKIGIGDVILLATRSSGQSVEELTGLLKAQSQRQGYTVRDDGAIAIPEVGAVPIAGLTLEQAEDRVFQRLVQNQLDPEFSLEISEFNSKRISIGGAVERPVLIPVTLNPVYLDEALTTAGGLAVPANKPGLIRIYRQGKRYQIPLDVYYKDNSLRKTVLADGDSVYIDSELKTEIDARREELAERRSVFESKVKLGAINRDHIYLAGEVSQQSRIALPFDSKATLADIFYENGGFPTTTGNPAHIYILRLQHAEELDAYHLNATNVANLVMATKFEMRPDDIVFVREQPITAWSRTLQQIFPTLLSIGASQLNN